MAEDKKENNASGDSSGASAGGGESGMAYVTSKNGIIKAIILVFGCITFALIAANGVRGVGGWILAAFIIAWCFTLFSYFFIVTTLKSQMNCGIQYEVVDFVLSVISFFHCLAAAIVLSIYNCSQCDLLIAANIFGYLTVIMYFVEIYFNQEYAPEPLKYLTTVPGIVKLVILIFGCIAFALLVAGGYNCNADSACDSGRTFALAAYVISWTGSLIFMLLYVTGLSEKIGDKIKTADFVWSVFSFIFYLIASIVLAVYVECDNNACNFGTSYRTGSCIFGFFTTIAYLIEAILLKTNAPNITPVNT